MNPADAVDLLKKEYDKHSKVAKRQWIVQNTPELIEEYKKLLRQEGGYLVGLLIILHLGNAFCSSSI